MAMTDEEKESLNASKDSKTWRACRTAARTCLSKLDRLEPGKTLQDTFMPEQDPEPAGNGASATTVGGNGPEIASVNMMGASG